MVARVRVREPFLFLCKANVTKCRCTTKCRCHGRVTTNNGQTAFVQIGGASDERVRVTWKVDKKATRAPATVSRCLRHNAAKERDIRCYSLDGNKYLLLLTKNRETKRWSQKDVRKAVHFWALQRAVS